MSKIGLEGHLQGQQPPERPPEIHRHLLDRATANKLGVIPTGSGVARNHGPIAEKTGEAEPEPVTSSVKRIRHSRGQE